MRTSGPRTICWNCSKACGGCDWSGCDHMPITGWKAEKTQIKLHCESSRKNIIYTDSYVVLECPLFDRDATEYGLKWTNKKNNVARKGKVNS